jgi:DNA-binding NarL/FixJ family response regulator
MRVAIIAHAVALRAGLRVILTGGADRSLLGQNVLEVVYETGSVSEYLVDYPEVDLLILEAEFLADSDLARIAKRAEGQLGIIALGDDPHLSNTLMTLPVHAWGILSPDVSEDELLAAVVAVGQGLLTGSPNLLKPMLSPTFIMETDDLDQFQARLTERESQVLEQLALGLANKQIAYTLKISEHTVKFHISSIYSKLGVANRTEAVRAGVKHGLITL